MPDLTNLGTHPMHTCSRFPVGQHFVLVWSVEHQMQQPDPEGPGTYGGDKGGGAVPLLIPCAHVRGSLVWDRRAYLWRQLTMAHHLTAHVRKSLLDMCSAIIIIIIYSGRARIQDSV
jgi:hypothetical protein